MGKSSLSCSAATTMLVTDSTQKLPNSPGTRATRVLPDNELGLLDTSQHQSATCTSSTACPAHVQDKPRSFYLKEEEGQDDLVHHLPGCACDTCESALETAHYIIPTDKSVSLFQGHYYCGGSLLCANNNSSASPVINLDSPKKKSSTTNITDIPGPPAVSSVQTGSRDLLDASAASSQSRLSEFDGMSNQAKQKPVHEYNQSDARDQLLPDALQGKHISTDTLDELDSLDVYSSVSSVDCTTVLSVLYKPAVVVEGGEPEPVSSSVDGACGPYAQETKVKETSDWDEPEPLSSGVDAALILLPPSEAKVEGCVLQNQHTNDCDATDKVHTLSKNLQEPSGPENVTSDSACGLPLEPVFKFVHPEMSTPCGPNQVGVFDIIFENGEQITGSESTKSAKKESLSETTGMEISHNELPVDSENSESGVPLIEVTDTEQKSGCGKNGGGGLLAKERKQTQGNVLSLRQRHIGLAHGHVSEGSQVSPEQTSPVVEAQRPGGVSEASAVLDRRTTLNSVREAQHAQVLAARAQRVMEREELLHHPYDASFMVMVGLCLTSVLILLNQLYGIFDVAYQFFI